MHVPAKHRAARTKGRHRIDGSRRHAPHPTLRLGESAPESSGYARHIGRIGALAVALGVGAALATGHGAGVARADDGSDSSSAGTPSGSPSSSNTSTSAGNTPGADTSAPVSTVGATDPDDPAEPSSSSTTGTGPSEPKVPEMNYSSSGGAHTSGTAGTSGTSAATELDADDEAAEPPAEQATDAGGTGTAPVVVTPTTLTKPAVKSNDSQPPSMESAAPERQVGTQYTSTTSTGQSAQADETANLEAVTDTPVTVTTSVATAPMIAELEVPEPEPIEQSVVATVLTAALAPFVLPGPAAPATQPLLWTLLAWTRRESELSTARAESAALQGIANDIYTTLVDTPVTGNLLANDVVSAGDSIELSSMPSHGTVVLDITTGDFTYTPDAGYIGSDEFIYTVKDATGNVTSAPVSIAVLAANEPPAATDDQFEVEAGQTITDWVTYNDADPEGESFVVVEHTEPAHGTLTIGNTGLFTYTPATGFVGEDSFEYTIVDPRGATSTATVTITVTAPAPVVRDIEISVPRGTSDTFTLPTYGSTAPRWLDVPPPNSGVLTTDAGGRYTFTADAKFVGTVTLRYSIVNAVGETEIGTVAITVANIAPNAAGDTYSVKQDTPLKVDADKGVLANDLDAEGDAFVVTDLAAEPAHGSVKIAADGSFVYTPDKGFFGVDEFSYAIEDTYGDRSTGKVRIEVVEVPNLAPKAGDDVLITTLDTPVTFDPTWNDADPEGQPLSIVGFTQPGHGVVSRNEDGSFTYTPNAGFSEGDSFTYEVTDGTHTVEATVYITIVAGDQPPVAKDDVITVAHGEQVIIDVLGNDYDPDGEELYISDYGTPKFGSTGGWRGQMIEYTPDEDALEAAGGKVFTDTFTYTVTDSAGNTSTATVTVRILPPNQGPVAQDDQVETKPDTPVIIDVLANDSDPDGDKLKIESYGKPGYGTLTVKEGIFVYTPQKGFVGTDSFDYNVVDSSGRISHAFVTITVKDPNGGGGGENPGKGYTVDKDRTLTVSVGDGVKAETNYKDWKTVLNVKPSHGTLTLNDDGSFTYTPDKGFVGEDTFVYFFNNGRQADGPFTATIVVTEIDEPGPEPEPTDQANYGATLALDSAMGACWGQWMPWQQGPGTENLTCLYPEARSKEL